ncbi:N-(5'-phosphoribosyl)anthranilate isomerase [Deltaproteobacteria bacterium Smac51]|nr:N-(5'-phosphoribosyl)anthranilate isomerase [Deltaproteobacteria bacterium Smac51]
MKPIIKICGICREEDAVFCAEAGADWLGFIFHADSPRHASIEAVGGFDTGRAKRVGVFVSQTPEEIDRIMARAKLDLAQLHGGQSADFCRAVGVERVVRTIWPQRYHTGDDLRRERDELAESVSYFLYDAGTSGGGHGLSFDPALISELSPRPWLMAGGMTAERAAGLMSSKLPALANLAGFDFNSGVEKSPGVKDRFLVESTISAARNAAHAIEALRGTDSV